MQEFIISFAQLIRKFLPEVSFGITAVTLMLAGPSINAFIQRLTQKLNWFLRYLVFIVVCTAGYGVLAQLLYRNLKHWLGYQQSLALILITVAIYLLLAFFAKKQGHI